MFRKKEKFFTKYEDFGAYHFEYYFNQSQPYYVDLINSVQSLIKKNSIILDLGCGDGLIDYVLYVNKSCQCFGLDDNSTAIELAKKKNIKTNNSFYKLSVYDNWQLPPIYDYVLMLDVIEHLYYPKEVLQKAYNSLKKNGCLIISTPLYEENKKIDPFHIKEYSKNELSKIMSPLFQLEKEIIKKYQEINYISVWRKK